MWLVLLLLGSLYPTINAQLKWRYINTTSTPPPGRRDHALAYDGRNNRLILFGGRGSTDRLDDTWEFNMGTNTWRKLSTLISPEKRFSFVYGISGDAMYISTGQDVGSILYNDIWRFNLTTDQWEKILAKGPKPGTVYGAAGGFYSNTSKLFYVTHGFSLSKRYANTLAFDIETDTWEEVFDDKSSYIYGHPNGRCLQGGTMVDEKQLAMYGGCLTGGQTGGPCPAYDSWLFDGMERSWEQLEYCASPRRYPSLALLPVVNGKRRAVLYGGGEDHKTLLSHDSADADQVAVLNVNDKKWTLKRAGGNEIPIKRVGAAMIQHPQGIIMFGGSNLNDLWLLEGNAEDADKTPNHSQTCKKPFAGTLNLIMLHGVFMVIGWGILLQLGAFIARYFRKHDPMWFHLHRVCQVSGLLFGIAGFVCAVMSVGFDHFKFGHGGLGLVITILGILQPINAVIRPHKKKNEPVALKRKIWEFIHLNSGRIALICAVVEIPLGLLQAQAYIGHHIAYYVYVAVFFVVYVVMEIRLQISKSRTTDSFEMR